ncbi:MAG: Helix-turn-helix domain [Frankiales bacterium]|nr:Helix-turn-helix domain [Frankiales bacterium]
MDTPTRLWGEEIVRRRRDRGWTQKDLAEKVRTTQQHLSLIERGAVSAGDDLRLRIAAALEVEVADLFVWPTVLPA